MNKVLNRPLFRQAALRKGHLKTIGARTGIMVGQSYSPPGVPAVVPGQGTFSPVNTQRFGPPKPTLNIGGSMGKLKRLWIRFKVHLLKCYFEMSGILKKKK